MTSEAGQRRTPPPASGGYPRFSAAELRRRHDAPAAVMDAHGVDHVLVRGAHRVGTAVGWLTRWPVTQAAIAVVTPGRPDALLLAAPATPARA